MPSRLNIICTTVHVLLIFGIFCLPTQSDAITTTHNGVTVEWDAWFTDIRPDPVFPQISDNYYYVSDQLSPYGDELPITITLPKVFTQGAAAILTLWSEAGGSYPYHIVKSVQQTMNPDGSYKFSDLVIDETTYVNISMPQSKGHAFSFEVVSYPDPNDSSKRVRFVVHLSLSPSVSKSLEKNPDGKGPPDPPPGPPPGPDPPPVPPPSCEIGFPTYTVNPANLNLVVQDTEFSLQSLGPGLVTTRTWNTDPSQAGIFGNGWSFSFESTLQKFCGGAQIVSGSGKGLVYTAGLCPTSGSPSYPVEAVAPVGIFDKLTYMGDDYWLLTEKVSRQTYRYDPVSPGGDRYRLTSITDRNGNALAILYNSDGTISSVTDAAGRQFTFIYDGSKRAIALGTPDGRQVIFGYDAQGNLIRTVDLFGTEILYQYDVDNYMTAMSYAGKMISYTYDTSGDWKHVARIIDANGAVRSYTGTTGSSKTTMTDARGGTTATTSSAGKITSVLDALGKQTLMTYANGLRTSVTDPKNNKVLMAYDSRGNMTKITDANGKVTTYVYDASDNLVSRTNPLGETWTYTYDGRNNLTSVTSPGNNASTLTYDAKGELIGITDANGQSRTFTYDSFGNRKTMTDPLGKTTTFGYDSSGINRTSALDPNGNASTFAYDQNRRLTRITNADGTHSDFSYDGCAMTGVSDENSHSISFSRDQMLRVTGTTDAMNSLSTNSYDGNGNLVTAINPLQLIIAMIYDAADRLATVTDPIGGSVQFARDANGNVTAIRDERLKQTAFTFDANNRKLSTTDPLGRMVNITRDDLGRMKQQQNARGSLIGTAYDSDGRLTAKTYGAATVATYAYDKAGNFISFTDAGGTTTYAYNGRNEVTGIVYPDGNAVAFAYDAAGNMVTTNYPGGPALIYGISSRNLIQTMQWDTTNVTFSHDAAGNLMSETRSNGTSSEYVYDANNRVTSILHKKGAITIAAMDYIRNAAGDIVTENVSQPAAISLTNGSEPGVYDNGNQISTFGGSTYSHDLDGNLTGISGGRTFTASYDVENRPVQITAGGVTGSYSYNTLGNRVEAVRNGQATRYYHDHRGRLLFEADGNGAIVNFFLYREGRLVTMRNASGGSFFYHYDKTGNTVAITDGSGNIVNAYAYTPFGELAGSTETVANRFKYVGAYGVTDEGSNIYFMKNRYYDAVIGRFIQKDPIGFAAGQTNLYAYVGNNPVDQTDPNGLIVVGPLAWFGGAAAAFPFVDDPFKSEREQQQQSMMRRMMNGMDSVSRIDGDSFHNYAKCEVAPKDRLKYLIW